MIGIIGAMEDEVVLLREHLEYKKKDTIGGGEYTSGKLGNKDVVLLRCGIGKVNAAVGCTLLINNFKPNLIINTGSAGGTGCPAGTLPKIGDIIISKGLAYHDFDLTPLKYEPGQVPGLPQIFPANEQLLNKALLAVDELKARHVLPPEMNVLQGLICSSDAFMHKKEQIEKVRQFFPDVLAVDMESAAIAHCCHLFYIPVLIIRALSDIAGESSTVSFHDFLSVASRHSAELVMQIIKNS